jgi:hypothetical protein
VTTIGPDRVMWFERGTGEARTAEEWLFAMGGGLWESVRCSGTQVDGRAAWRVAQRESLFGDWLPGETAQNDSLRDGQALSRSFKRLCPGGIVYVPGDPRSGVLDRLSSKERRIVLLDAVFFAERLRPRPSRTPFEVTTLCAPGQLQLLFLAPRDRGRSGRALWLSRIRLANLVAALTSGDGTTSSAERDATASIPSSAGPPVRPRA